LKLPIYPGERDYERHFKKMQQKFQVLNPTHLIVAAVRYKGTPRKERVDGLTRSYGWEKNLIPIPKQQLTVLVYDVSDADEAKFIYDMHNNAATTKDARDNAFTAMELANFEAKSKWCKKATFSTGMKVAEASRRHLPSNNHTNIPMDPELIDTWREELATVDEWFIKGRPLVVTSGVLAAIFMTLRKSGRETEIFRGEVVKTATHFWHQVLFAKEGVDIGHPSQRLRIAISRAETKGQGGGAVIIEKTLVTCLGWFEAAMTRRKNAKCRTIDPREYL
jgi:hypothetical protein